MAEPSPPAYIYLRENVLIYSYIKFKLSITLRIKNQTTNPSDKNYIAKVKIKLFFFIYFFSFTGRYAYRVRGCVMPFPSTGRGGAPKFFLNWLTSASKPYDSDHIWYFSSTSRYTPLDSSWPSLLLPLTSIYEKIFKLIRQK